MTLAELVLALHFGGVTADTSGMLRGPTAVLAGLREHLLAYRNELRLVMAPGLESIVDSWGMPDLAELVRERAAIMEFDGGLPRELAYRLSVIECETVLPVPAKIPA